MTSPRLVAISSACAVVVSLFSTMVSCSSQREVEVLRQDYAACQTKVLALNEIIQGRFPEFDQITRDTAALMYNQGGAPYVRPDTESQRAATALMQATATLIDRIWREASPFMSGARKVEFDKLYQDKFDAFTAIEKANLSQSYSNEIGMVALTAMNTFVTRSPILIGDEVNQTLTASRCK